jgi:hypothetical protein
VTADGRRGCRTIDAPTKGSIMGEKGNGGHVATGGARAVRQAAGPSDLGMGGSHLAGDTGGGGGSVFSDLASDATDHVTDLGGAVVDRNKKDSDET